MTMPFRIACLLGVMAPAAAVAEHQHGAIANTGATSFGIGLSLVAAEFDTMAYGGDYQGFAPSVRWTSGRFAVSGNVPLYRLQRNGLATMGPGDAFVHGQVMLVHRHPLRGGVLFAVSLPTGERSSGFGMGHAMMMPAAWGSWEHGNFVLGASMGYGLAIGGASHHMHNQAWPLVEPMNQAELTWTASGELAISRARGRAFRAGMRTSGAVPAGADGATRVIGGVRVTWIQRRIETSFELQAGIAGDPFTFRGVLETSLQF